MATNHGAITNSSSSFLLLIFFSIFALSHAFDSISSNGTLRDNETLVSAGEVFELGFFSDPFSGNQYMGIWFKDDPGKKPVWVANRDNPLINSTCFLQIRDDGNLIIIDRRLTPVIVNSGALSTSPNTTATLFDTGNFVLQAGLNIIWQSFDYPSDTYLPGMKIGWFGLTSDLPTIQVLSAWASPSNPSGGNFTLGVDYKVANLSVYRGDSDHVNIGYWDGNRIHFIFANSSNSFNFSYFSNADEAYFTFNTIGNYTMSWLVMASTGLIDEYTLSNRSISMVSHSLCEDSGNYTVNGSFCLPSSPSTCNATFSVINGSLSNSSIVNGSIVMSFSDCESICASNCSCVAYTAPDTDQSGCQIYFGNEGDLSNIIQKGGGLVYVRGDVPTKKKARRSRRMLWVVLGASQLVTILLIVVSLWCYIHRRRRNSTVNQVRSQDYANSALQVTILELNGENDQELPMLSFSTIEIATNDFAIANILGEGGFGPVYKGRLPQGEEIAVKRLSRRSGQGITEFKNEINLISKLQHRNLVRLQGYCIHGEEKILIYEYMSNNSLDSFIFDSNKRKLLDWTKRSKIIEGIAQGLLYLHKYSRLRIIHRDVKTSNILLDSDMTPKISDFGMARIFEENESQAKTKRIVGTYGYMSPEYAMNGLYSEKSDVFSFGIVVLEIVSGKRNIAFFETLHTSNLLGNAWNSWKEEKHTEFMDSTLANSCSSIEVLRYVQIGLLCVQERATDRPSMSDVVSMLSNETTTLPYPKEPALLSYVSNTTVGESSKTKQKTKQVTWCNTVESAFSEVCPR